MGKRDHRSITLRGDMTVACDIVKRLKIISRNISVKDRRYLYQLSIRSSSSPLCLCVEGIVRPSLNPPLCAASVCSVLVQSRGRGMRKRAVDLDRSQGQSGFYSG